MLSNDLEVSIAGLVGLNSWYKGISGLFTYCADIVLTYLVAKNKNKKFKNLLFKKSVLLDYELKDMNELPIFSNWKVLECLGHTGIDLTIYNQDLGIAYIADNLIKIKDRIFQPYPVTFPDKYKKSLNRYIELGINHFLLAHHGYSKISHQEIEKAIYQVPIKPRRHRNTLVTIGIKLLKSSFRKRNSF